MNLTTIVNQLGQTEYVEVAGTHVSAGTYLIETRTHRALRAVSDPPQHVMKGPRFH